MRKVAKGISIFAAWPLLIAILFASIVTITFSPGIYASEQDKLGIAEVVGCSPSILDTINAKLIAFMKSGDQIELEMNATINGENRQVFSEKEKYHMYDVWYLIELVKYFMWIAVAASAMSVVCALLLGQPGRRLLDLASGLLWGMASFALAVIVLAVIMLIDFSKFWTAFHRIFFANDLWQLDPSTDVLIQMMPEQFFIDMILYIGAMFIGIVAVIAIACAFAKFTMMKKLADTHPAAIAQTPSDDTMTAIPAQDGERFVLNANDQGQRPAAEEIFEEFGLSDKDDKPLLPDEMQTTRPLVSAQPAAPKPAAPEPQPVQEPEIKLVMPPSSQETSFEPVKSFKLDEEPAAREEAPMTFVKPEPSGDFEPFTDISAGAGLFKFFEDAPSAQEPGEDGFTLQPMKADSPHDPFETPAQPQPAQPVQELAAQIPEESSVVVEPAAPAMPAEPVVPVAPPKPVAPPEPVAQPEPVVQPEPVAQPETVAPPVPAAETIVPQTTRKFVPITDEEPETEVYTPGEERRPAAQRRTTPKIRPSERISLNVPVTIPASHVDLSKIDNGVKIELKLELRLREDGSLEPALPQELKRPVRDDVVPQEPETARAEEPKDSGPSVSDLLAQMDQIMAGFPAEDGKEP